MLKETPVPLHVHLSVIKKLKETVEEYKQSLHEIQSFHLKASEERKMQKQEHDAFIAKYEALLEELASTDWTGQPGKDADEEKIIKSVLAQIVIPEPQPGKDAVIDEESLAKQMLDYIKKEGLLDLTHIKDAQRFIKDGVSYRVEELMHGSGSRGGSATIYTETPSGLINGSNRTYTVAHTITTVIGMWINGEFIHPGEYTVSGAGFTMGTALPLALSGSSFTISYT